MKTLELGWGDLSEVNKLDGNVVTIARKIVGTSDKHVTAIKGDFFSDVTIKEIIALGKFDCIRANYSLCFNSENIIQEKLPLILKTLKKGGVLIISDFQSNERTVSNRVNLDEEWFFDLIQKCVNNKFKIKRKEVFEEKHNHTHCIFQITANKA